MVAVVAMVALMVVVSAEVVGGSGGGCCGGSDDCDGSGNGWCVVVGWRRTSKVRRYDHDDDGGGGDEHTHTHARRWRSSILLLCGRPACVIDGTLLSAATVAAAVAGEYVYIYMYVYGRGGVDRAPPRRRWWTLVRPCARVDECECANACLRASRRIFARWAERAKFSPGPTCLKVKTVALPVTTTRLLGVCVCVLWIRDLSFLADQFLVSSV